MNYRERVAKELLKVYEELLKTPPIIVFLLTCMAVLLVGALILFSGASR